MPYPFATSIPHYYQIELDVKRQILSGTLPEGEKLPNEVDLAQAYGVSRQTVRQAILDLVAEGLLVRSRGLGTFVRHTLFVDDAESFVRFQESESSGLHRAELVEANLLVPPPEVAGPLSLGPGDRVCAVLLRRWRQGTPLALRTVFIPEHLAPELPDLLTRQSFEAALDALGLTPAQAVQTFRALRCGPEEATYLRMPAGDPVMVWQGNLYTRTGLLLAFVRTVFRGDRVSFTIRQGRAIESSPPGSP